MATTSGSPYSIQYRVWPITNEWAIQLFKDSTKRDCLRDEHWNTLCCWCWISGCISEKMRNFKKDSSNSPEPQEHSGACSAANAVRLKLQSQEAIQAICCSTWAEKQKRMNLESVTKCIYTLASNITPSKGKGKERRGQTRLKDTFAEGTACDANRKRSFFF